MKRILTTLATITLLLSLAAPALATTAPTPIKLPTSYTDYSTFPAWVSAAISDASLWGIISGYPDGSFQASGNIKRDEFAKMLAVAMGDATPAPNQSVMAAFSDIGTADVAWATPYLQSLSSAGVLSTNMYGSTLNPTGPITRAEAAAWISAGLKYFGVAPSGANTSFSDVPTSGTLTENGAVVPVSSLGAAAAAGIIKGYPDGTFQPSGSITRAEAAAMLTRFVAALPGYGQLAAQTPDIGDLADSSKQVTTAWLNSFCPKQTCFGTGPVILSSANLGEFTPATTQAQFRAEPTATWQQVHLWMATQNWLALGEAKLNTNEASYVANYPGLQAYQVAEIMIVASQYWDTVQHSPLDTALQPSAKDGPGGGTITPVSSVQLLGDTAHPWFGAPGLEFTVNGAAGVFHGAIDFQVDLHSGPNTTTLQYPYLITTVMNLDN